MPNWFSRFTMKAPEDRTISATVPLVNTLTDIAYPTEDYGNYASQGYGRSEIVHACIRELSTGVSSPRYYVAQGTSEGGMMEVDDNPLAMLLKYPNPNQDFYHWIERLNTYLQVSGNAYIYKTRNRAGQVVSLWLLRPDRVSIVPNNIGSNDYSYEIDGKQYHLESHDVGHIAFPNPSDDVYGLSPLSVLAKTINLDLTMTDFAKMYFANAGVPSGLLKVKRRLTSQEDATRIRNRWRSSFGGSRNMHQVAVLDEDAEYQPMANSPNHMALTDLRNHTESRICAVFGVPPILISANVGLARSTFSNYREARFSFHSATLEPLLNRIVRYLNYCLAPDFPEQGEITLDLSQMRAFLDDKDSITTRSINLFQGGVVTLNEAREMQGLDALENGDVRRVPSALSEVAEGTPSFGPLTVEPEPEEAVPYLEEAQSIGELKRAPALASRARRLQKLMAVNRERLTDSLEKKLLRYYKRIQNKMDGVLGRYMERGVDVSKDLPIRLDDLLPADDFGDLNDMLYRAYFATVKQTVDDVNHSGVAGFVSFNEKLPLVQTIVTQSSTRAHMIHETLRKQVEKMLKVSFERGYTIEQVARGVPKEKFPGIKSLVTEGITRARLIARTETMRTQNLAATKSYEQRGFAYVRADDPDGDPNDDYIAEDGRTCIQRHNQIYRVEDAMEVNDHPNGRLVWQPMPRNYQPQEA